MKFSQIPSYINEITFSIFENWKFKTVIEFNS